MRFFVHDIIRDMGELFGYNMRGLITALLGVASEYNDFDKSDRFFAAVDLILFLMFFLLNTCVK